MISVTTILIWTSFFISLYVIIFWLLVFIEGDVETKKRKITHFPLVSLVIPAYNEGKRHLRETIDSVLALNYPMDKLEIIAVNHGSTDDTGEIMDSYKDRIKVMYISRSEGERKGRAVNEALKISKGEFFVCMDADCTIEKDALIKMLPHFSEENIASVLPLMKVKNPKKLLQKIQWCEYLVNFFYKSLMSKLDCIHVTPGPFSIYRKDILEKIGMFDEKNLTEDLEISLRLQKHHYKIIQLLDTEVYTVAPDNLKDFYSQRNRWYKGAVLNAFGYKNLMFNKEYGDFAFIQMPRILIAGITAVTLLGVAVYQYILSPLIDKIYALYIIDFNLITITNTFRNVGALDFNYTNFFYLIVIFILILIVLRASHRYTKETFGRYGYITIPSYLILYSILASIAWVTVVFDLLRNKKQQW
tara:strand:- start:11721 stop:12968 length:1248 start_codon:yes stop_codon:yes gene_type:complete